MGRRNLRPIDPNLDLSFHLRDLRSLPEESLDWPTLFGRDAPLEIEVGTGKGLFIHQAAGQCPEHNFAGVEVSGKYARFAAARLAKSNIPNAMLFHGDANRMFGCMLQSDSVAAVHIYFPDPWWKERHTKRRIMNDKFLQLVHQALQPGGLLHFWTDVERYFRDALHVIAETTPFSTPIDVPERAASHDMDYHTHFERRTRLHEQPVYRAQFVK